MSEPVPGLYCPPELVLAAWISSIPGLTVDSVAPQLPSDDTTWAANGAVMMLVVGGTDDPYMPYSRTVLQVECWGCAPGTDEPPWLLSWNLAARIRMACLDRVNFGRPLAISFNGVTYPGANTRGIYTLTTARRVYGDRADYAGHIFDVAMTWAQENLLVR